MAGQKGEFTKQKGHDTGDLNTRGSLAIMRHSSRDISSQRHARTNTHGYENTEQIYLT